MLQRTKAAVNARRLETSLQKTILHCSLASKSWPKVQLDGFYCHVYGISVFATQIYYNFFLFLLKGNFRQSRTKVLRHLSRTKAFYQSPSVCSKTILLSIAYSPSPPFQCCNTLRWHCHVVTTLKGGEGVEMWKLKIENFTHLMR